MPPKKAPAPLSQELQVALLDAASEPLVNLKHALAGVGLDSANSERLLRRLRARIMPATNELRAVKTGSIVAKIEDKIDRALDWLDDEVLAASSAKDLAIVLGIMIEKRNLLRGEPTHIFSSTERQSLDELMPQLMKEAERRGLTIEMEMSEEGAYVLPAPHEQQIRPRSGGMTLQERGKKKKIAIADADGEPMGGG